MRMAPYFKCLRLSITRVVVWVTRCHILAMPSTRRFVDVLQSVFVVLSLPVAVSRCGGETTVADMGQGADSGAVGGASAQTCISECSFVECTDTPDDSDRTCRDLCTSYPPTTEELECLMATPCEDLTVELLRFVSHESECGGGR